MEPLAGRLCQCHAECGLNFLLRRLVVSMYADPMTVYVRHPEENVPPLIREFIRFGGLSGMTINWTKTVIFLLTPAISKLSRLLLEMG